MGFFHRIWKKLAIREPKFEIQICTFAWKFWISRMKSWSNTARWNFVDLKVSGRLTRIQVFIETGFVQPDWKKGTTKHKTMRSSYQSWRFAAKADALSDLRAEIHPQHHTAWLSRAKQPLSTLLTVLWIKKRRIVWARILMRTRCRIGATDI